MGKIVYNDKETSDNDGEEEDMFKDVLDQYIDNH